MTPAECRTDREMSMGKKQSAKPQRDPGCYGKIQGVGTTEEPTLVGTTVTVADVLDSLERANSVDDVCVEFGIVPADVQACVAWRGKSEAERAAISTPAEPKSPRRKLTTNERNEADAGKRLARVDRMNDRLIEIASKIESLETERIGLECSVAAERKIIAALRGETAET